MIYHSQLNEGQFIIEFRLVLKFIDAIVLAHKSYGASKQKKKQHILQKFSFYVPQRKESNMHLEKHKGE